MNNDLLFSLFGLFFIGAGFLGLVGYWKSWYWGARQTAYWYVPMGVLFLVISFQSRLLSSLGQPVLYAIYVVIGLVTAWLYFCPPQFIKPAWIRTIEEQPDWVYLEMVAQVKAKKDWRLRVKDQTSLKAWIATILREKQKTEVK